MSAALVRRMLCGLAFREGGHGVPLVLLHGIPGSSASWEDVACRLVGKFRVIAIDLMGFGDSEPPAGDFYLEAQARAVGRLLECLEVRSLFLVGHDFGGPVAITLHRIFPELEVRGLALANTNVFTDPFVPLPLRAAWVPVLGRLAFRILAGTCLGMRAVHLRAVANKRALPWTRFRRVLSARGLDTTWRIFHRSLANLRAGYGPVQAHLCRLQCPTLVIWGARDPFFPASAGIRTHEAIRGSAFLLYPESGHFPAEESPERFASDLLEYFS
jgi:pimeloyl-ACP methyl ester carboxylesterase